MDGKALVFIHIPRTGGATLRPIIERQFPRDVVYRTYRYGDKRVREAISEFKNLPEGKKRKIMCLTGHMPFGLYRYLPRPAVHITMLRHPVDQVVSGYYHVLKTPQNYYHEKVTSENIGLADYVDSGMSARNRQARVTSGIQETDPAAARGPLSADVLDLAKRNLREHFVVAGLTERFDESLLMFRRFLEWRNVCYVRRNVSRNRPPLRRIPGATIRIIEKHNELDMELYEFARRRFEELVREQGPSFARDVCFFRRWNKVYGVAVQAYGRLRKGVRGVEAVARKLRAVMR